MRSYLLAAVAVAALVPMAAQAGDLRSSFQVEANSGLTNYIAAPDIVGQTSTATIASGGNPLYQATAQKYSGVVALIMNEGAAGTFICSGALLADRQSVLTAGHCISHGNGSITPISTTAYFYNGGNPDLVVPFNAAATAVAVSNYYVDARYTGEVIDDNDIAIVRLATPAPAFAQAYDLYTGNPVGLEYNIAGYGGRSDTGGSVGQNLGTGRLRQGNNVYDYQFGDSDFGGLFDPGPGDTGFFGTAEDKFTLIADFDNGTAANDANCKIAVLGIGLPASPKYCNTGLGAIEVSSAPGDSGGPQFINGQISSVTSFGLTFGPNFGDSDNKLNDSWGELNGFTPVYTHLDFIAHAIAAPEPASWGLLMVGFGLTGAAMRRRRKAVAA